MNEDIVVALIVAVVLLLALRSLYRTVRGKGVGCRCGGGCRAAGPLSPGGDTGDAKEARGAKIVCKGTCRGLGH
ncbi:MAG: FeoB-associated Cys-rich membrane protein [Deltaproteobacteria bacterium]|nr:FeoB-associated Cys-rich membrane protein [Deltaproteobacteria bacterium]